MLEFSLFCSSTQRGAPQAEGMGQVTASSQGSLGSGGWGYSLGGFSEQDKLLG